MYVRTCIRRYVCVCITVCKCILLFFILFIEQNENGESVHVSESHPEVVAIVTAAVEKLSKELPPPTNEMLVQALKMKVNELDEAKSAEGKQKKCVSLFAMV